jgi:PAS domain S-box-containing protein
MLPNHKKFVPGSTWFKNFLPIKPPAPSPKQITQMLWQVPAFKQRILEAMPDTVYVYDLVDQRNVYSTRPLMEMLGYTTEQIRAMGIMGAAKLIHPQDLDQVANHFQRFITLVAGETIEIEYRVKRANGKWCWLRSVETPFVQAIDGFPLQILGIMQDVTQQKQSEALVRESLVKESLAIHVISAKTATPAIAADKEHSSSRKRFRNTRLCREKLPLSYKLVKLLQNAGESRKYRP